jgi:hypothetical protein
MAMSGETWQAGTGNYMERMGQASLGRQGQEWMSATWRDLEWQARLGASLSG